MSGLGRNGQYYYSPDIKAFVQTANNGIVDISEDVIRFTINRQVNAVSTANLILANNNFKYTPSSNAGNTSTVPPVINTMDAIVISLKREKYIQVFTGFITYAPIITLIPSPIELNASCTLYKAQQSYWDAGAIQFQDIIPNAIFNWNANPENYVDGGIGTGITNILQKVCNWKGGINIGKVPNKWMTLAATLYGETNAQAKIDAVAGLLNSAGITIDPISGFGTQTGDGSTPDASYQSNYNQDPGAVFPQTSTLTGTPLTLDQIKKVGTQNITYIASNAHLERYDDIIKSTTISSLKYWCSIPWPYYNSTTTNNSVGFSKSFLAGQAPQGVQKGAQYPSGVPSRLIAIQNPDNGVIVFCFAAFASPFGTPQNNIGLSPLAYADLKSGSTKPLSNLTILGFVDKTSKTGLTGKKYFTPAQPTATSNKPTTKTTSSTNNPNSLGAQALAYARLVTGSKYVWGGNISPAKVGPLDSGTKSKITQPNTDCSGLVQWAYAQVGKTISRTTQSQYLQYQLKAGVPLEPGDLLFYYATNQTDKSQVNTVSHVAMYVSDGVVFQALGDGYATKQYSGDTKNYFVATRPGGDPSVLRNPASLITVGSTAATANFNNQQMSPNSDGTANALVGNAAAFITDQPALSTINTLATTGLRCFQSAPNGDFLSWFPDYFGIYGTAPAMSIRDIEIIDLKIYHDDTQLYTHIGVSGDPIGGGQGVNLADWMETPGLITVEQQSTLNMLFGYKASDPNSKYGQTPGSITKFLARYGMRPYVDEEPQIRSTLMEFMYAWQTFMHLWSTQYNTQASFTFMPELYPGMIIYLPDHNIQLYVVNVTHQGSREGGFSTEATLTCPARIPAGSFIYDKSGNVTGTKNPPVPMDFGFPFTP